MHPLVEEGLRRCMEVFEGRVCIMSNSAGTRYVRLRTAFRACLVFNGKQVFATMCCRAASLPGATRQGPKHGSCKQVPRDVLSLQNTAVADLIMSRFRSALIVCTRSGCSFCKKPRLQTRCQLRWALLLPWAWAAHSRKFTMLGALSSGVRCRC